MDDARFDRLARGLASIATRRGTLLGLAGGLLAPLLPEADAEAKKSRGKGGDKRRKNGHDQRQNARDDQGGKNQLDSEKKKKKKKKCKPPTIKCGNACLDPAADPANCGGCGQTCAAGQACQGGACTCDGTRCTGCCDGTTCQGGNLDQQCGTGGVACGVCSGGQTCQGGACACPAGQAFCGGACVDTKGDAANCGGCGNVCPGLGSPNTNVTCQNSACTFSCQGEKYDVNGAAADGCEQSSSFSAHTQQTARSLGTHSCADSDGGSFTGAILSDARVHESPAVAGFNAAVGAAPQWWVAFASGGFTCQNDPAVTLTMTGGANGCYTLSLITDKGTHSATVVNGAASIVLPSRSYSDGTNVYFVVEKTCGANVREAAAYTVTYHL